MSNAGGPYNYDWVGNRLNPPANLNPMIYNAADQLMLWPGMHSYLYDDNGALTHVKTADGSVVQQSFTYHPTGLMNTAAFQGGTMANIWDADEHRVKFTTGGQDYNFIFDPTAGIPAILAENTPAGTVYYIREPGGELIARVSGSDIFYYQFDELGSTRLITDDSGAVTDRFTYDAYGSVLSHNRYAGSIDQPYQYVGRLGYYTHYMQPEFSWLQLGVRFYEPELGRFERRDPITFLGGMYSYLYSWTSPLVTVDPQGRSNTIITNPPRTIITNPRPPRTIITNPQPRKPSLREYWGCMSLCTSFFTIPSLELAVFCNALPPGYLRLACIAGYVSVSGCAWTFACDQMCRTEDRIWCVESGDPSWPPPEYGSGQDGPTPPSTEKPYGPQCEDMRRRPVRR